MDEDVLVVPPSNGASKRRVAYYYDSEFAIIFTPGFHRLYFER